MMLFNLPLDCPAGEAELFGRDSPVAVVRPQALLQNRALHRLQRHPLRQPETVRRHGTRTARQGEGISRQDTVHREQNRRLDHIAQLPDIPGPIVRFQRLEEIGTDRGDGLAVLRRGTGDKAVRQRTDIRPPFPQRRQWCIAGEP